MGLSRVENSGGSGGCLFLEPEIDADKVAYEGLLGYEDSAGKWKERWFVLDADRVALVKCAPSSRQRSRSYALGGNVYIKEVHPLSLSKNAPHPNGASQSSNRGQPEPGLAVTTEKGTVIRFRAKFLDEEQKWLAAVAKLSSGFAAGVGEKLAEHELLAGKYSLVREFGRGTAGIVSLYTWQGKPFAVKKFLPQKAKPMPNCRVTPGLGGAATGPPRLTKAAAASAPGGTIPDEIRREIALLKEASHLPYVIQLHDVILDPKHGNYYLVMKYMGGGAIAEWDSERKCYVSSRQSKSVCLPDEATVRRYTTRLLLGIQALHRHRVCHRDIKPENLMASDDKSMCKIGDLGVAHYFKKQENGALSEEDDVSAIELWDVGDNSNEAATAENDKDNDSLKKKRKGMLRSTKGTYQFLPPETLSGDEFCGFKADVWSIGATLCALSFGSLPFFSADLVQLFEKIENDVMVFPHTCQDEDLKELLSAILDKSPETRISIEGILNHRWLRRNVDSKALQSEVRGALKRSSSTLDIGDHDLGLAVSVLQRRFDAMSHAVQRDDVGEDEAIDASKIAAVQVGSVDATRASGMASYVPRPIAVDGALALPKWFLKDTELIATQLHYDWCCAKYVHGWKYGAVRDDAALVHPYLMPMRELPKDEQEKNVRCVVETMKCVVALGCHLRQPKSSKASAARRREVPLAMHKNVTLCWETMMLIDLLAENAHEVWADGYVRGGWRFGAEFDTETRTHPSLKPYMALDEQEKDLSRDAVTSIFTACVCLGYEIKCSRRRAVS